MPAPSSLNALRITNKIKAFFGRLLTIVKTDFASQSRYVFVLEKISFEHNFQIYTSYIIVPDDRYLCSVLYIIH